MDKSNKDSSMKNSNKVETITISNMEQLKQIIKYKSYNNYELVEPIMIKGVKGQKPEPKAPAWFSNWVKNQYEKDIERQNQFNKQVLDHLEKHDQIFKRNNLK